MQYNPNGLPPVVEFLSDNGLLAALSRMECVALDGCARSESTHYRSVVSTVIRDGHGRNVAAGWWHELHTGKLLDRNAGELLMLAVSELAEIPENHLFSTMDDKLPERLMFECELADFIIRAMDTAGAYAHDFPEAFIQAGNLHSFGDNAPPWCDMNNDRYLFNVVRDVSNALEGARKNRTMENGPGAGLKQFDYGLAMAVVGVFRIGNMAGLNITEAIVDKMRFNASRADHKPENRAMADGKKF